jgi:hypothetical protein
MPETLGTSRSSGSCEPFARHPTAPCPSDWGSTGISFRTSLTWGWQAHLVPEPSQPVRPEPACDPDLYDRLGIVIASGRRSVAKLEGVGILPQGSLTLNQDLVESKTA